MYRIGEFSKLCKTSIKTLRYYDEIGLLKPAFCDGETNYRFYTTDQLVKFHVINSYRQVGMSIDEIKLILAGSEEKGLLEKRKQELLAERARIDEQLRRIAFIKEGVDDEKLMNYHAVIKELPSCIVYSKKLTITDYNDYFTLIPAIGEAMIAANPEMKCTVPEYCYIVYLDSEYKERNYTIEYCEAVDRIGVAPEGITFKKIESLQAVSIMHKGSYSKLNLAYAYAYRWLENNGYLACESPREVYIDGIWNKEDENEWLTELQVPIIKKKSEN